MNQTITWTNAELDRIARSEELQISSMRDDGTLRQPVTIWVVRVGDALYVRAVKGRTGPWFRGTQTQHQGHIRAGGVDKDVTFEDAAPEMADRIDEAYRTKYHRYDANIVGSTLTPQARAATLKLTPR